jgi:biotin--protein ligase
MKDILVYNGPGVDGEYLNYTVSCLARLLSGYPIKIIGPSEVREGNWLATTALFVMPGGADIPYGKQLNGVGNQHIKKFVTEGGRYLGFCAGAYYAGEEVVFDLGGQFEVVGKRELGFFPGQVVGPYYLYATMMDITSGPNSLVVRYHCGGKFIATKSANVAVIATYDIDSQPAIVKVTCGKGIAALLGVHPEYPTEDPSVDALMRQILVDELELPARASLGVKP